MFAGNINATLLSYIHACAIVKEKPSEPEKEYQIPIGAIEDVMRIPFT
jgi:hypothetical protein